MPIAGEGGTVILTGNLCPSGAVLLADEAPDSLKPVHPDVGSEQKPEEEPDEVKHSQGEWIPDTPEPVSREGTECG